MLIVLLFELPAKYKNMQITFLQASYGDAIHIEHGGHHVIIDGGNKCEELESVVKDIIDSHEVIDLLIITHYDEDHILGIYKILQKLSNDISLKDLVHEVWFNATKLGFDGNEYALSSNQAVSMSKLLIKNNVNWVSSLKKKKIFKIDEDVCLEVLYGGDVYEPNAEDNFMGTTGCDWDSSFKELESYVDDDVLDESPTNKQSIILVLHDGERQILLPGDATPDKLNLAIDEYLANGHSKVFDLIKLPHHGSYRNVTEQILKSIICNDYVVCTNGKRYCHPDKKMLLKLSKWGQVKDGDKLHVHLNYYEDLFPKLNISEQDMQTYKFDCDGQRVF